MPHATDKLDELKKKLSKQVKDWNIDENICLELLKSAAEARKKAYAPYSGFKVGAAVLTEENRIFSGCNIENSSFGATICAERVALGNAVSVGQRRIKALVIIGDYPKPLPPCGICRQVIAEFNEGTTVVMANLNGDLQINSLADLLPGIFQLEK